MHAENASAACCAFAICAGVGRRPFGSSLLHACCAARNFGDPGSTPEPELSWMTPCPFGSGKLTSPCERMHAENFAPSAPAGTFIAMPKCWLPPPELDVPGAASAGVLWVVVGSSDGGRLATEGAFPPPPHPAASKPTPATVRTAAGTRVPIIATVQT